MISKVSRLSGTIGIWKVGSPPSIEARSPTRGTGNPKPMTKAATTPMATSGAGTALVTLGTAQISTMVSPTRPSVSSSGQPVIQTCSPDSLTVLNCSI